MSQPSSVKLLPPKQFDYTSVPHNLGDELRKSAELIRDGIRRTTAAGIVVGVELNKWKVEIEHGLFTRWIEAELGITARTAQNLMSLAGFAEGKNEIVSLLPLSLAYRLAARATPPEISGAVLRRLEAGEWVNQHEVDALLYRAREERKEAKRKEKQAARRPSISKSTQTRRANYEQEQAKIRADREAKADFHATEVVEKLGAESAQWLFERYGSGYSVSELNCIDWWAVCHALQRFFAKKKATA